MWGILFHLVQKPILAVNYDARISTELLGTAASNNVTNLTNTERGTYC
jgi:hypothetical protein